MATPSQIEANPWNAQKSTGPRTEQGKDRSRFHAVKHGMDAGVPTPVVFQPVEPLTPTSLDAKSSTESPAPAKFEISQNEANFVNIDSTKALNGDHREDRGLDLEAGRRYVFTAKANHALRPENRTTDRTDDTDQTAED